MVVRKVGFLSQPFVGRGFILGVEGDHNVMGLITASPDFVVLFGGLCWYYPSFLHRRLCFPDVKHSQ